MAQTFAATVAEWAGKIPEATEAVFKGSAQQLVHELNNELERLIYETPESPNYKRTKFLQASLMASTSEMPRTTLENPGRPVQPEFGTIELVINSMDAGQVLYLGYTANYGPYVHFGANGMPPRPWVTLVAQRWQEIVKQQVAIVRQRFGL